MSNQFFSPEGDIENYFVDEYWLIDQYVGDQLWVWGSNSSGQLGENNLTAASTPITTFAGRNDWKLVSCGEFISAAIKTDGTLWLWGVNSYGQLGTNNSIDRSTPVTTFAGGTDWKQVSCSRNHIAAIKNDGSLWTWGLNSYCRLGINNTTNILTPVTTFAGGTNWKQVSVGDAITAAVKTDGTLWFWGRGGRGQSGTNDVNNKSTPVTTFAGGTNWKQVSCGGYQTGAVKTDGTLWNWGTGGSGQLGNNSTGTRLTPVTTFAGGNNWKQVSSSVRGMAAIKTDGTLWTWGRSNETGDNTLVNRLTPVTTFAGGTNWKLVNSQGSDSVAAIKTDGTLWVWGSSLKLGTNDAITRSTPVTTFAGGSNWKQVATCLSHTIAVTSGTTPELPLS